MKIALLQMQSGSDVAANVAQFNELAERAIREERPDWLSPPENWNWAGGSTADKVANADRADGPAPARDAAREIARKHGVWVHAGSILTREGNEDKIFNRTYVFNRRGEEVARYDKIHLFDVTAPDGTSYRESASMKPGRKVVSYDCEGLRIGCAICYDVRFPELFQLLQAEGCDVIALPASFTLQTGKDHWEVLLRARAIETQSFVLATGMTGSYALPSGEKRFTYGHSMAIDPWGHVVARASDGVGYAAARLDLSLIARVRQQIPVAAHKVLGPVRPQLAAE
jgi:deaminated glutathione amidase